MYSTDWLGREGGRKGTPSVVDVCGARVVRWVGTNSVHQQSCLLCWRGSLSVFLRDTSLRIFLKVYNACMYAVGIVFLQRSFLFHSSNPFRSRQGRLNRTTSLFIWYFVLDTLWCCDFPHRTAPHRTAPHRTAPHRTAPHRRVAWTRGLSGRSKEPPRPGP